MDFLWEFYQQGQISAANSKSDRALSNVGRVEDRIRALENANDQLKLINIAFAELLVQKLGVGESEIVDKIKEIDLRDGVQDGKISIGARLCPKCNRRYNAKANKCLYCGFSDASSQTIFDKIK